MLTGVNVTVGAVGFIADPTETVPLYETEPISVAPENVCRISDTVLDVLLGICA